MKQSFEALSDASKDAIPTRPLPAIITLAVGLVLSCLLWAEQGRQTKFVLESRFLRACERQALDLQESLRSHLNSLYSIQSFFHASQEVERGEFEIFSRPLLKIYPVVHAFEWIPRVSADKADDYTRRAVEDGIENFVLLETSSDGERAPVRPRDEYFPAYYLSPVLGSEVALGLDYASDPDRSEAMRRSLMDDRVTMTRPMRLLRFANDRQDPYGLVAFIPVFGPGTEPADSETNPELLRGYVAATFHAGEMIDHTLRRHRYPGIRWKVEVPDDENKGSAAGDPVLLYRYPSDSKDSPQIEPAVFEWSTDIGLGGQEWRVTFEATPEFEPEVSRSKRLVVPLTAVFTTIIVALVVNEFERRRQQRIVHQMALEDPLTGLLNRRAFDIVAEHAVRVAIRSRKGFVLVMADLDHLKRINDGLGHAEGDLAIRKAGRAIRDSIRKSDIAARIGGDEFCMILRETDLKGFEVFRRHLSEALASDGGSPVGHPVGMSMGEAYFDPEAPRTVADLMKLADKRLYQNKSRR